MVQLGGNTVLSWGRKEALARGIGVDLPFLHRKHGDWPRAPYLRRTGQIAWGISTPPPLKASGQLSSILVQWGRGEKKGPYSPSPQPGPPARVLTPGNATANGSLRIGALAEGPGGDGQTPGRSRSRGDPGPRALETPARLARGRRVSSPRPSRSRSPAGLPSAGCLVRTPVIR